MDHIDAEGVNGRTACSVQPCKNLLDPKSRYTTCGVCREVSRSRNAACVLQRREAKAESLANGERRCSRPYCDRPADSARFSLCSECRRAHRKVNQRKAARRREQGKCIGCKDPTVGKSCFCFKHAMRSAIKGLRRSAKSRNREVTITDEQITALILSECFYCGVGPNPTNGVDRLINEHGYHIDNCCACCGTCNHIKGTQRADEFLDRCARTRKRLDSLPPSEHDKTRPN